jgi:hypothetical protein
MAVAPLIVATVRALWRGWMPLGDNGLILLRAQDVGTSNHPLLGLWSSASLAAGRYVNHPGPLFFDVLAPFVRLGGPSVGVAVGVLAVNLAAVVGAAWAAGRAGGLRALVLVTALSAGLAWAMGSELLFDAWQPHAMILPFWALLVMCWCLATGDVILAPFVVGVASLVVQTHLSFVYVVAAIVIASGAVLATVLLHVARGGGDRWAVQRTSLRRAGAWSMVVAGLAWLQPLIDQFAGTGNLGALLAAAGDEQDRLGLEIGTRVLGSVVALPPWWTRPGFSSTIRATALVDGEGGRTLAEGEVAGSGAALLALLVVFAVLGAVIVVGWRRRHRPTMALGMLAVVSVASAWASVALMPVGAIGISPHQMRWLWPISAFVLLAAAVALLEWPPLRRAAVPAGLILTGVAAVANLPTYAAPEGPTADRDAGDTAAALVRQMSTYRPEGPVLFDPTTLRFAEPYSWRVLAELTSNGIDIAVTDEGMVRQLGEDRRADGDEAPRLVLLEGAAATSPPSDAKTVALVMGLSTEEQAELDRLRPEVLALASREGLVLNEAGRAAAAAGRIPLAPTVLAPGADPSGIDFWLPALVGNGYVELSGDQRIPFQRYTELARRFDRGTVGVFALPTEPAGGS